jgi:hypothetical protein
MYSSPLRDSLTNDKVFSEAGNYFALSPDSSYVSATSTLPRFTINNCPGTEAIINSEIGSNSITPHVSLFGMPYDYSNHDLLLSSGNYEPYEHMMSGQLGVEQLQLNHRPTTSFGVEDLQQVSGFQSGFSQLNPIYGSVPVDSHLEIPSFPPLDLGRSSPSSFSPFDLSAAATLGFSSIPDPYVELSDQHIWGNMNTQWGPSSSLEISSTTEAFNSVVQEQGSFQNPCTISENPETATKIQLSSADINLTDRSPNSFGPSRMVSLPPARKGGRKGPLSVAELKKRREAKKQGVCIRCRQLKEKVVIM